MTVCRNNMAVRDRGRAGDSRAHVRPHVYWTKCVDRDPHDDTDNEQNSEAQNPFEVMHSHKHLTRILFAAVPQFCR